MTSSLNDDLDFTIPIRTSGIGVAFRRTADSDSDSEYSSSTDSLCTESQPIQRLMFVFRPLSLAAWLLLPVVFAASVTVVYIAERISAAIRFPVSGRSASSAISSSPSQLQQTTLTTTAELSSSSSWTRRLTLSEVLWSVLSALLLQSKWTLSGDDVITDHRGARVIDRGSSLRPPRSAASKLALSTVGVFSLGLIVSYAANLAAIRMSMTSHHTAHAGCRSAALSSQVSSIRDLVGWRDIDYAVESDGDLTVLLGSGDHSAVLLERAITDSRRSPVPWQTDDPQRDIGVGPEAVMTAIGGRGDDRRATVFVGDSLAAQYAARRSCGRVGEIGVLSETKFYSIGLHRKDEHIKNAINSALMLLTDQGIVKQLQNR